VTTARILFAAAAAGGVLAFPAAARGADVLPALVTGLTGNLHVEQHIPCGGLVIRNSAVTGGVMQLTPAEGVDVSGNKQFVLTFVYLTFQDFTASGSCGVFSGSSAYTGVGAELARSVAFTAVPSNGIYAFTIPKGDFLLTVNDVLNGNAEHSIRQPSQNVTGTIDLVNAVFTVQVELSQSLHFKECPIVCVIDEVDSGTMAANISGTIAFPDADGDGVPDRSDNCRLTANPTQSPVATPELIAPPNVTLLSCLDHALGAVQAVDICDGGPLTLTNNAPGQLPTGQTTVTWTATDAKNRSTQANQVVTVIDKTPPAFTFVPLDINAIDCGPIPIGTATATDDCAGTPTITNDAPGYFYVGTTVVTWKATDAASNSTTAVQKVTVVDKTPPTVACTPDNPTGQSFVVTGFDACGATVLRLGTFVIGNGEQIKIEGTGQPGIRLKNAVGADGVRHFLVGKGQAVITATDESNNVSTAVCR
jgi:Thrombospondin type 3 repeat